MEITHMFISVNLYICILLSTQRIGLVLCRVTCINLKSYVRRKVRCEKACIVYLVCVVGKTDQWMKGWLGIGMV